MSALTRSAGETPADPRAVGAGEAFLVWLKIGLLSFGGPAGQIALMHRILVEEKRWIDDRRFLHALNYCMLLPGPEAQQLAVYVGWLLHRTWGGIVAGTLFVLPGALVMLALSLVYAGFGGQSLVQALFLGIKAAVLAIVIDAVRRIGGRALGNRAMVAVAVVSFVAIFLFAVPFPIIVGVAALVGYLGSRQRPDLFKAAGHGAAGHGGADDGPVNGAAAVRPTLGRAVAVTAVCLPLWFAPIAVAAWALGPDHVLVVEGLFFSRMAVVTFGGAYAVLGYIAQQAVETYAWLSPGEMLDGLGLAETTPGPLILVAQFVGFLAAFRHAVEFDPMWAGVLGAAMTTWVTFVPCFFWIFLGAPYVEALRGNRALGAALSAITAAVVGVVLNLAVWFALHVSFAEVDEAWVGPLRLFVPVWSSVDAVSVALSAAALVAILKFRVGVIPVLAVAAAIGVASSMALP